MTDESGQRLRSEVERNLPGWAIDAMDRARSGINPNTNGPMSHEDAVAFVNSFLPQGDPGRMRKR